jgi:hypothetical protein
VGSKVGARKAVRVRGVGNGSVLRSLSLSLSEVSEAEESPN